MPLTVKCPHEDRLKTLAEAKKTDEALAKIIFECQTLYQVFSSEFINAFAQKDFIGMAKALDDYRWYARDRENEYKILGDRTKYYSSILEEVPVLLVKKKGSS